MSERKQKRGFVYLALALHSGGLYKIGRTLNLKSRISGLNTGSPLPIRLVHWVECADYVHVEWNLHEAFCGLQERGEWFRLCDRRAQEVIDDMNDQAIR